jgi:DNA invertase Pin-like site-specific DNA recombinase
VDVVTETASGGVQNGAEFSWEHRPVLLELIERARAGEFEVLLVARLDRLSRDHATLVVLERRLQRH